MRASRHGALAALLLAAAAACCCLPGCGATLLVADAYGGRVMELRGDAHTCTLFQDREAVRYKLATSDPRRVRLSSPEQFDALMQACHEHDDGLRDHGQRGQPGFIYPGTNWCGPGNRALHYDDLGYHRAEDACCREHDHCPAVLEAGHCVQGLCNNALFTKSHCNCDARFRRCLRSVASETANLIGALYFNVAQVTCFKEKRPCFPEDVDDRSGRCRARFHAQARYEEAGGYSAASSVSNLLSSFLPFN